MIFIYYIEPSTGGPGRRMIYAAPGLSHSEKDQKRGRRNALNNYRKQWNQEGVITGYSLQPENKEEAQILSESDDRPDDSERAE